jgi:hypothetical protein
MKIVPDGYLERIAACPVSVIAVDEHDVCASQEIERRLSENLRVGPPGDLKEIESVVSIDCR